MYQLILLVLALLATLGSAQYYYGGYGYGSHGYGYAGYPSAYGYGAGYGSLYYK